MNLVRQILTDARFALRLLRRSPGFAATLLAVLAVGIGATTAMFSLVLNLLVRPLPFPQADELFVVRYSQPMVSGSSVSIPDFLDWKAGMTSAAALSATAYESFSLSSGGETPENLHGLTASGDYFAVLGVRPLHGRFFGPDDDRIGAPKVAVLGAGVWHRRFGSDPGIVGRAVTLNGEPFTIIGVAPEGFAFGHHYTTKVEIWTPIAVTRRAYAEESSPERRGTHFAEVVGRRRADVSLAQANAELGAIVKTLATKYPNQNYGTSVRLEDLHDALVGSAKDGIWVLFGAVGLVFLVMCANVANLLLARAAARRAEMATRAALGASRWRLAGQIVTETVTIFLLGAALGTGLAYWFVGLFAGGLVPGGGAATIDVRVDGAALAFAIGVATLCGIVFGLVPAREASRQEPHEILKETGARTSMSRSQKLLRGGLVVVQVALALTLLAGSGLALRAFVRLASTPAGFDPEGLVAASVGLAEGKYADTARLRAFYETALDRMRAIPGVTAVASNSQLPMSGSNSNGSFLIEGREEWPMGASPQLEHNMISPGYFQTMKIPILRGREFTAADGEGARLVMVISKATAEKFFPNEDPIGHRIDFGSGATKDRVWFEIVGVAGDVRRRGLAEPIAFESYVPVAQVPLRWVNFVVRTSQPDRVFQEIPRIVAAIDPEQAVGRRQAMSERVENTIGAQRFATRLLGAFAIVALLLATLGIFGLVSYTTSQRTRELGIRFALGSSPEGVVAVVMREGVRLLAAGLGLGLVGAFFTGRVIAERMKGAAAFDPLVFGAILGVLAFAGLLASFLPAVRAVRISPAIALRYE